MIGFCECKTVGSEIELLIIFLQKLEIGLKCDKKCLTNFVSRILLVNGNAYIEVMKYSIRVPHTYKHVLYSQIHSGHFIGPFTGR